MNLKTSLYGSGFLLILALTAAAAKTQPLAPFARLDKADTPSGYLARLLINEVPFPGERAYVSETDTKNAMNEILWVLHSRINLIPAGYTQQQVAGVRSKNIIDVITGAGGKRQCEGFYRDAKGQFVTDPRVEERITYLLKIANKGSKPGRFSNLLNYGQDLARTYLQEGMEGVCVFADIKQIGSIEVTGLAYSWMTDVDMYHPGGNFVSIPSANNGSIGGNRFFTLRKQPK